MKTKDRLAQQHLSRMAEVFLTEDNTDTVASMVVGLIENGGLRKKMGRIVRDYCSDHMRSEITKFAGLMEMKLLKHDSARGQRGWKDGQPDFYLDRIEAIVVELRHAVEQSKSVGIKAADLANHAMILADMFGELEDI